MPIIVAGKLRIKPGFRGEFIERSVPSIELARQADGCLDFSVSRDPVDSNRVNICELWVSSKALNDFRNTGPEDDLFTLVDAFDIKEYEVSVNS